MESDTARTVECTLYDYSLICYIFLPSQWQLALEVIYKHLIVSCQWHIARLGHTGARALATRGRAPPVQVYANELLVLIVSLSIANRKPNWAQTIEKRGIDMYIVHSPIDDRASESTWEVVKSQTFSRTACPRSSNASALCPCCALASPMPWLRHCILYSLGSNVL